MKPKTNLPSEKKPEEQKPTKEDVADGIQLFFQRIGINLLKVIGVLVALFFSSVSWVEHALDPIICKKMLLYKTKSERSICSIVLISEEEPVRNN